MIRLELDCKIDSLRNTEMDTWEAENGITSMDTMKRKGPKLSELQTLFRHIFFWGGAIHLKKKKKKKKIQMNCFETKKKWVRNLRGKKGVEDDLGSGDAGRKTTPFFLLGMMVGAEYLFSSISSGHFLFCARRK